MGLPRLERKTVVVSGAGQGLGRAYARRFGQAGCRVVIAEVNADRGEAAAAEVRQDGGEAMFVRCDVGDSASCASMARAAGIRVNAITPGPVYTEVPRETVTEAQQQAMLEGQCLKRLAGPDDLVGTVAFLIPTTARGSRARPSTLTAAWRSPERRLLTTSPVTKVSVSATRTSAACLPGRPTGRTGHGRRSEPRAGSRGREIQAITRTREPCPQPIIWVTAPTPSTT